MPVDNLFEPLNSGEINNLVPVQHQVVMLPELIQLAWTELAEPRDPPQKKLTKHWLGSSKHPEWPQPPALPQECEPLGPTLRDAHARASPPLPAKCQELSGMRNPRETAGARN